MVTPSVVIREDRVEALRLDLVGPRTTMSSRMNKEPWVARCCSAIPTETLGIGALRTRNSR
jgi:hypothetical protein